MPQTKTQNVAWALKCTGGDSSLYFFPIASRSTLVTARHSTAQHSTALHSIAQHSAALQSTAQRSAAQRSAAQRSIAKHSTAQRSAAQRSAEQRSAAQHGTARHGTARHGFEGCQGTLYIQDRPNTTRPATKHQGRQGTQDFAVGGNGCVSYRNLITPNKYMPMLILATSTSSSG